jgi:nucleotide-binding universal stress UspA family protein
LLTIVTRERDALRAEPSEVREHVEQALRRGPLQELERQVKRSAEHGVTAFSEVGFGDPAEEILIAASLPETAAIVIATHGRGGLKRLMLGSVADRVMRESACPVLIVSPRGYSAAAADTASGVALGHLLVPLDGSALAEAALPEAVRLAEATGADVTLVRVEQWLTATVAGEGYASNLPQFEDEIAQAAYRYLDQVRAGLPCTITTDRTVLRGTPAECLIAFVEQKRADLIVMTTHGRGGVRRLVLGSVADRLARSGLPVLLVPASATGDKGASMQVAACG